MRWEWVKTAAEQVSEVYHQTTRQVAQYSYSNGKSTPPENGSIYNIWRILPNTAICVQQGQNRIQLIQTPSRSREHETTSEEPHPTSSYSTHLVALRQQSNYGTRGRITIQAVQIRFRSFQGFRSSMDHRPDCRFFCLSIRRSVREQFRLRSANRSSFRSGSLQHPTAPYLLRPSGHKTHWVPIHRLHFKDFPSWAVAKFPEVASVPQICIAKLYTSKVPLRLLFVFLSLFPFLVPTTSAKRLLLCALPIFIHYSYCRS